MSFHSTGEDTVIAFTVTHGDSQTYVQNSKIEWTGDVITNAGGGYIPDQNEFQCPVSGLYQFTLSTSGTNGGNTITEIWMSDHETEHFLVTTHATGLSWGATSNSVIVYCTSGNRVFVRSVARCRHVCFMAQ